MNFERLSEKFNTFRKENLNTVFTAEQLYMGLKEIGINKNIVGKLVKFKHIESENVAGGKKLYSFKSTPTHYSVFESLYKAFNKKQLERVRQKKSNHKTPSVSTIVEITEEEMVARLQATGKYRIQKFDGFDMDALMKDHPEILKQYLKYKTI